MVKVFKLQKQEKIKYVSISLSDHGLTIDQVMSFFQEGANTFEKAPRFREPYKTKDILYFDSPPPVGHSFSQEIAS